jgi:hypothetical protein
MIKIQKESREELKDTSIGGFPLGWWVAVNSDTIYNVSRDGGPGDHMGYLWAEENSDKMGLSDIETKSIEVAYGTNFQFKIYPDTYYWWIDDSEEDYYRNLINSKDASQWRQIYDKAMDKIDSNFIRVLYNKSDKTLYVQVYNDSRKYYDRFMKFLLELLEVYKVESVYVEDYSEDNCIWNDIPIIDALNSKGFDD